MPDGQSILFVRYEPDADGFLHPDLFLWTPGERRRPPAHHARPICAIPIPRRTAAGPSPCATATASRRSCGSISRPGAVTPLTAAGGRRGLRPPADLAGRPARRLRPPPRGLLAAGGPGSRGRRGDRDRAAGRRHRLLAGLERGRPHALRGGGPARLHRPLRLRRRRLRRSRAAHPDAGRRARPDADAGRLGPLLPQSGAGRLRPPPAAAGVHPETAAVPPAPELPRELAPAVRPPAPEPPRAVRPRRRGAGPALRPGTAGALPRCSPAAPPPPAASGRRGSAAATWWAASTGSLLGSVGGARLARGRSAGGDLAGLAGRGGLPPLPLATSARPTRRPCAGRGSALDLDPPGDRAERLAGLAVGRRRARPRRPARSGSACSPIAERRTWTSASAPSPAAWGGYRRWGLWRIEPALGAHFEAGQHRRRRRLDPLGGRRPSRPRPRRRPASRSPGGATPRGISPQPFDGYQLGGAETSLLPGSVLSNRIAVPALPLGTRIGTEHEGERAELTLGFLPAPLFYERHRVWGFGDAARRLAHPRRPGVPLPPRRPCPSSASPPSTCGWAWRGSSTIRSGEFEGSTRWWLITAWRP